MQPNNLIIQESVDLKGQLSAHSLNESALNESALSESRIKEPIDSVQPISAIISQLLEKYDLLNDDEPLQPPVLDDHFSFGHRWGSVLTESNLHCQSLSSPSTRLD